MDKRKNKKWTTCIVTLAFLGSGTTAYMQPENDYDEPTDYGQEEWYDPADWFDDDFQDEEYTYSTVDSDYDSIAGDRNADWVYWDHDELWEDDFDYDSGDTDVYYTWDDKQNDWVEESGESDQLYDVGTIAVLYSTNYDSSNQQKNLRSKDDRSWKDMPRQGKISGTIEGFRHLKLSAGSQDTKRAYTITKIKLDNGKTIAVNLGEKQRLTSLDLETGDDVQIRGVMGRLDGEPVFIANQLKTQNRTFDVNRAFDKINSIERQNKGTNNQDRFDRDRQNVRGNLYEDDSDYTSRSDSMDQSDSPRQMTVRGTVQQAKTITLQGNNDNRQRNYVLARLKLQNDNSILVNLGEKDRVDRIDLEQGEQVKLRGVKGEVDGNNVFIVNQLKTQDGTFNVNRAFVGLNRYEREQMQRQNNTSSYEDDWESEY